MNDVGAAVEPLRDAWFLDLVTRVHEAAGGIGTALATACGNRTAAAFYYVNIVRDHINGSNSTEIAERLSSTLPDVSTGDVVCEAIGHFRTYGLHGSLGDDIDALWSTLFALAQHHGTTVDTLAAACHQAGPELKHILGRSWGWVRRPLHAAPPAPPFPAIDELVVRLPTPHLDPYRAAWFAAADRTTYLRDIEHFLLPVEVVNILPDRADAGRADVALAFAARIIDIPYTIVGGWCDVYPGAVEIVPGWLRDQIITGGARSYRYTTGTLHTLIAVADSALAADSIVRLLKTAKQFGYESDGDRITLHLIAPSFDGDPDPAWIGYFYDLRDPESVRSLLTIAATGHVRLEVVQVQAGHILFKGATRMDFPHDFRTTLRTACLSSYDKQWDGSGARFVEALVSGHLIDQAEWRFRGAENARHELLFELSPLKGVSAAPTDDQAHHEACRRRLIDVLSDNARRTLAGAAADHAAEDSAWREFEIALSRVRGADRGGVPDVPEIPPECGFLHVDVRDGLIDLTAVRSNDDGSKEYSWLALEPDAALGDALTTFLRDRYRRGVPFTSLADSVERLIEKFDRLLTVESVAEMVGDLRHLILSGGDLLDGVPFHSLALAGDRTWITYAPSLRFLDGLKGRARVTRGGSRASVLAYQGGGTGIAYLPGVGYEAKVLERVLGADTVVDLAASPDAVLARAGRSRIVHIATHGVAGASAASRGLLLAPGGAAGFLSAVDLLRDPVLLGTDLLYLSACSTSVSDHTETVVQSFGGVDFAALASGATWCAATCWQVHDVSAVLFAALLHFHLGRGQPLDVAYRTAQRTLREDLAFIPIELTTVLSDVWPQWHDEWMSVTRRTSPVHWGAVRIAGGWLGQSSGASGLA